jgi:hypothetical protein
MAEKLLNTKAKQGGVSGVEKTSNKRSKLEAEVLKGRATSEASWRQRC